MIRSDNDEFILGIIETIVRHSDPEAKLRVDQGANGDMFTISPSDKLFRQDIINNLLFLKKHWGVTVIFSKSLAISKSISFTIKAS